MHPQQEDNTSQQAGEGAISSPASPGAKLSPKKLLGAIFLPGRSHLTHIFPRFSSRASL